MQTECVAQSSSSSSSSSCTGGCSAGQRAKPKTETVCHGAHIDMLTTSKWSPLQPRHHHWILFRGRGKCADDHLSLRLSSISFPSTGAISRQEKPPRPLPPSFLLNTILINPLSSEDAFQPVRTDTQDTLILLPKDSSVREGAELTALFTAEMQKGI